jgi:uncharacterized protein YdiU (UPF0061 family)
MSTANPSPTELTAGNAEPHAAKIPFQNAYARLPEYFYARINPTPVAAPRLIKLNLDLANKLGLDADFLASAEGVEILAGNRVAQGSEPLAQAYAGHQFGHFVPQLGDGRANLLGEVIARDGLRYDIQLKGSGRTPFSRGGDGRAALGPVLREYIVSEAMAALGVPSTRALAAVVTGDRVLREVALPGAIFTRVAASHLRVGTFQYFAARRDVPGIRILADFAIARHYPDATRTERPYQSLLEGVIGRHAQLVAQWLLLGFIHGVMNTDNTSISGETIDYGPCAFLEAYDLAEALLPVLTDEAGNEEAAVAAANHALSTFDPQFTTAFGNGLRRKLGLFTERDGDAALAEDLLERMAANQADFTLTFRRLCDAAASHEGDQAARALFADPSAYDAWAAAWRERLKQEPATAKERAAAMRAVNPLFIPRNHLVEAVIEAAVWRQDFQPFEELLDVVIHPYGDRPDRERYAKPARPEECVLQTFCGT